MNASSIVTFSQVPRQTVAAFDECLEWISTETETNKPKKVVPTLQPTLDPTTIEELVEEVRDASPFIFAPSTRATTKVQAGTHTQHTHG